MRFLLQAGMVAGGLMLTVGCATQPATLWFSPDFSGRPGLTYAILPFTDANSEKDRQKYPQAADIVAAALQAACMQNGLRVVNRGSEAISLAGTVTEFAQGSFGVTDTTVGLDVKAVDAKTGLALWTAKNCRLTKCGKEYDLNRVAAEATKQLVEQLLEAGLLR